MKIKNLALLGAFISAFATSVSAQGCVNDVDASVLFSLNGQTAQLDRLVDYTAVIAPRDRRNSKGVRLANFAAILQQDRANLHKSGKGDAVNGYRENADGYFTSLKRRSFLSRARYFTYCNSSLKDIATAIVNDKLPAGTLWVVVFRHPDRNPAMFISPAG